MAGAGCALVAGAVAVPPHATTASPNVAAPKIAMRAGRDDKHRRAKRNIDGLLSGRLAASLANGAKLGGADRREPVGTTGTSTGFLAPVRQLRGAADAHRARAR